MDDRIKKKVLAGILWVTAGFVVYYSTKLILVNRLPTPVADGIAFGFVMLVAAYSTPYWDMHHQRIPFHRAILWACLGGASMWFIGIVKVLLR